MKIHEFSDNHDVLSFVAWIGPQLGSLPVALQLPKSRFVPGGISMQLHGIEAVTTQYRWRASGMQRGDWAETQALGKSFSQRIQQAVADDDPVLALETAWAIIAWGGGNRSKGAYPILQALGAALLPYLRRTRDAFTLASADTDGVAAEVRAMNAMLSKVHAFLAVDGLPIYDSRVAVAMATLVEAWRRSMLPPAQLAVTPLPPVLTFPSVPSRKSQAQRVTLRYPDALAPPLLSSYSVANAADWSAAKVRLGWLMQVVLQQQPTLFSNAGELPERMRALEAALFMIGHDVRCLSGI